MVVDFDSTPLPTIRDNVVHSAVPLDERDMRISSFVSRLVATFKKRNIWLDYFS